MQSLKEVREEMKKSNFPNVSYLGGLQNISVAQEITIIILSHYHEVSFIGNGSKEIIRFQDIVDVSLNEKSTRNAGKAAVGAIVGGVLTGVIGLIAGAAIVGKKRNDSVIYITYRKGDREIDLLVKAKERTEDLYSALISASLQPPLSQEQIEKNEAKKIKTAEYLKKYTDNKTVDTIKTIFIIILLIPFAIIIYRVFFSH